MVSRAEGVGLNSRHRVKTQFFAFRLPYAVVRGNAQLCALTLAYVAFRGKAQFCALTLAYAFFSRKGVILNANVHTRTQAALQSKNLFRRKNQDWGGVQLITLDGASTMPISNNFRMKCKNRL